MIKKIGMFGSLGTSLALALALVLPHSASAALLTQQMQLGSRSADVSSLQVFLATRSEIYPEGIVSGYYGPLTAAAVRRFQAANGLPVVGRVGPVTIALINTQMQQGGGPVTGGLDISAPIIYPESVATTTNSATLSWTTNEAARGRVMYGTSWPFLYATAPSMMTSSFGTTANLTLSSLQPNTQYYYVLESVDAAGNVSWTVGKPLRIQ